MKRKRFFQKDLAAALGIDPSMVTRMKRQGCPMNSIAAAKRWREANLNPALVKEVRGWARDGGEKIAEISTASSTVNLVQKLAALAELDFERWEADLRAAMRLVPTPLRADILMPMPVWDRLTAHVREVIEAAEATDPELQAIRAADSPSQWTEADVEYVSNFWYSVAIGTVRNEG